MKRVLAVLVVLGVLSSARGFAQTCSPGETWLCLQGERFLVQAEWRLPGGEWTEATAVPLTSDTGTFWFFDNSNVELVLKVLDGRLVNGHFWVYYGGLSDVEYRISVFDVRTRTSKTYTNPAGRLVSRSDTAAFPGGSAAAAEGVAASEASTPSLPPALAVPPLRQGPEFRVNAAFPGDQWGSNVAIGPDGGFLVSWFGAGPQARLFDSAGRPRTGDIRLGDFGGWNARSAASLTGGYMVVWERDRLLGRIVGADGQLGEIFAIGTTGRPQRDPAIAAASDGGFLVAWMDLGPTPPGVPTAIRWQRFGSQGNRVGQERVIQRPGFQPQVAALAAGGFVLTWGERLPSPFPIENDILALRLSAGGQPLATEALRVNLDEVRHPGAHEGARPVAHPDGGFSVLWTTPPSSSAPGLLARRYGADGQPAGSVTRLHEGLAFSGSFAAAALPSGDHLVIRYAEGKPQDPDGGLFGQVFDRAWTGSGPELRVNTTTASAQFEPAVAVAPDGSVVATWSSGELFTVLPLPGLPLVDIFAQRFTLASCALDETQLCLGGRFRVEARFTDPRTGQPGTARAIPLTTDTGAFWFFNDSNAELVLKVLDGRPVNGRFWVYYGALSDVAYTITVTDTLTNQTKTYTNPRGTLASRADTGAF